MYADDVQLYTSCKLENVDACILELNNDLANITNWALRNGLCLNPLKSKCMVISKKSINLSGMHKVKLNNVNIDFVETAKNLGIIFNRTLSWNSHINSTIGKVYGMLRTLWTTRFFTPTDIRMLLAKTYLLPTLLYGCEIFANCDSVYKHKLNIIYNNITRYIFGLKRRDHVSAFSKKIYNMTFENLLKFRTLILLHKILTTKQPLYLFNMLKFSRSNRAKNLVQIRHFSLTSERQFLIYSIRLWNLLPNNIQFLSNAFQFKNNLINYFSQL